MNKIPSEEQQIEAGFVFKVYNSLKQPSNKCQTLFMTIQHGSTYKNDQLNCGNTFE